MRERISSILTLTRRARAGTDYGDRRPKCMFSPLRTYLCCSFCHLREQSSILGGLTPDDVMGVSGTAQKVRERLSGYIGNMEAVQAANRLGRTLKAKVPVREFTVESWYVEDEEGGVIAYGLL
jgi:hypothetical protein